MTGAPSYDLASLSCGRRSTLEGGVEESQDALVRSHQLCTQLSIFEGSLAELLRFLCCQLRKLGKSRGIAFLMLSSSKIEEVSQNSFVFKLADRQRDRQTTATTTTTSTTTTTTLLLPLQLEYITLHYTTLIALHYTTPHYAALWYTTLRYITLITLH